MALTASSVKLGKTVYRRVTNGNPSFTKGIVTEVQRYQYVYKRFLVKWDDGKEEWMSSKDLRYSKPGTTTNEKNRYKE